MRFFVVLAGLALAACATPCASVITEASTRTLQCEDGSLLTVTFNPTPNPVRVAQQGYPTLDIPSQSAPAGYHYVQGGAELRGTLGADAFWTRPGGLVTKCQEVVEPSAPAPALTEAAPATTTP